MKASTAKPGSEERKSLRRYIPKIEGVDGLNLTAQWSTQPKLAVNILFSPPKCLLSNPAVLYNASRLGSISNSK